MTGRFGGQVALVTGGGWNIGRACALGLAREGAHVVIVGRSAERLEETLEHARAEGLSMRSCVADVLELDQLEAAAQLALEATGRIDTALAIAGGHSRAEAVDAVDPKHWDYTLRVNLTGTFHTVRAVLPHMRAAGRGTLLTCGGGGSFFPILGEHALAYATAKAGLSRFTDQLAVELMDTALRVNCIVPGKVLDPAALAAIEAEEARTGQPHVAREGNHSPEAAAELALFLASDESAPLSGRSVAVDDTWWRDAAALPRVQASQHAYCLRRMEA